MTADERARLRGLADRIRRIRAYSSTRPHAFLEDKDEIARELIAWAREDEAATPAVVPDLDAAFGTALRRTVTVARGHAVTVERRHRAA